MLTFCKNVIFTVAEFELNIFYAICFCIGLVIAFSVQHGTGSVSHQFLYPSRSPLVLWVEGDTLIILE